MQDKKMKCACIILNYNDSETTIDLISRIKDYKNIGDIIVVDNCSSDDSYSILCKERKENIHIIATEYNGGYGYGNNVGLEYAKKVLGYDIGLISNPDVYFTDELVGIMIDKLDTSKKIAVVAPIQLDINGKIIRDFAWKLPSINEFIFTSGLIINKCNDCYRYSRNILEDKENLKKVDCVPGAFLALDLRKFGNVYYDESFFLYCEEMVIANIVKKNGFQTALLTKQRYQHKHSVSINKSINSIRKQRAILNNSRMLFLKKYMVANKSQILLAKLFWGISDVEALINEKIIKKLIKKQ